MRIRAAATLVATIAVWVGVTAATAPEPEQPQLPVATAGQSVDLAHEDTSDSSCWVEKVTSVDTAEAICGARGQRPAGAVDLGSVVVLDGQVWVATLGGLDPIGAN